MDAEEIARQRVKLNGRVERFCQAVEELGLAVEVTWRPNGRGPDCEIWITVPGEQHEQ